jgi:predicted transposase YdaD
MPKYDVTLKRLTDEFPEDYIRFALGLERFAVEVLHVEAVDKELPLLLREVDFAATVKVEEEFILLMEFQTDWKEDLPQRMLGYTWRLFEKYRLPVRPFLVLLREGGKPKDTLEMKALAKEVLRFEFTIVPAWEVDGERIVAGKLPGLYPLLPLMKSVEPEGRILERTQELIMNEIQGRERRADAYVALKVLAGIKYPLEVVEKILRRRDIMIESPVYEQILKEGREEGREETLKNSVLAVLEARFEVMPQDIEEGVKAVEGLRQLEIILKRASVCKDLAEFRDFLRKVKSAVLQ